MSAAEHDCSLKLRSVSARVHIWPTIRKQCRKHRVRTFVLCHRRRVQFCSTHFVAVRCVACMRICVHVRVVVCVSTHARLVVRVACMWHGSQCSHEHRVNYTLPIMFTVYIPHRIIARCHFSGSAWLASVDVMETSCQAAAILRFNSCEHTVLPVQIANAVGGHM